MTERAAPSNGILIIGVGRSGTSLLQAMLASHPRVFGHPETGFLRRYVVPRRLERLMSRGGRGAARAALDGDSVLRRVELPTSWVEQTPVVGADLDLYMRFQASAVADGRGHRWLDKDPRLSEYLPRVAVALPGVHVVHIIRDPRAVMHSKSHAAWSRGNSAARNLIASRTQLSLARYHGPRLFGPRFHEVRYEALVREPGPTLEHLCTLVGLTWDPAVLEFGKTAAMLMSPEERRWKGRTLGPLQANRIGAWADELSPAKTALCEAVFPELIAPDLYARSEAARRLGPVERAMVAGHALGIRAASGVLGRLARPRT